MTITKADVVQKTDVRTSPLPIENKVVADDVNELRRASDDTIDFLDGAAITPAIYGGLFICGGEGPAQTIESDQKITIDQWQTTQPSRGLAIDEGDQLITVPEAGVYDIRFTVSYETTSRGGEIFTIFTAQNGDIVPGICTRVQHQHPATTTYQAAAGRLVAYAEPIALSLAFEASTLSSPRTITIRHASLSIFRVDLIA